ncbi:MAG: M56 family metallopeptidase [Phycisphaerales bacterium]
MQSLDPSWLLLLTPPLFGVACGSLMLLAAYLAAKWSPEDDASDRVFVLLLAVMGVHATLLTSMIVRAVFAMSGDDIAEELAPTGAYTSIWVTIWLLGVTALVVRLTVGSARNWWITRRAHIPSSRIIVLLTDSCYRLAYHRRPRVLVSERCESPFVTGIFRPTIVLPADAESWDDMKQRAVIAHESAHLARHDTLFEFLLQLLCVAMWWNPLFWLVRREVVLLRETACDEAVLAEGVERHVYARILLSFAARSLGFGALGFGSVPMADGYRISDRISRVARVIQPRKVPAFEVSRGEAVLVVVIAVMIASSADTMTRTIVDAFDHETHLGELP